MTEPNLPREPSALVSPPLPRTHGQGHFEEGEETAPALSQMMALVRWGLVLAMAAIAVASVWYVVAASGGGHERENAVQYYCPMHAAVVQSTPGDCPICNMTLVERAVAPPTGQAPSDGGLMSVQLAPGRVQLMGMRTARVRRGRVPSSLRVVGVVALAEGAVVAVQTRFSGWIHELHAAETGQPIAQGQLLARIYSPELLAAQQELLSAKQWSRAEASAVGARTAQTAEFARSRLTLMGMDPDEVVEVLRTGQAHRLIEVRAPARGYLAEKAAVRGLFVQPGTELFRVADATQVWVLVDVYERDARSLRVGQDATVTLASYPGASLGGKVAFVYPALSPDTRTLRARIELPNPELSLKPGMLADVTLDTDSTEALLIPAEALIDMGEHTYVFVEPTPGHFEPRTVTIGARSANVLQVLSGLNEGETVVTTGNFLLDSESRLHTAAHTP